MIQNGDIVAGSEPEKLIPALRNPQIFFIAEEPDPRIGKSLHENFKLSIVRRIIQEQKLKITE